MSAKPKSTTTPKSSSSAGSCCPPSSSSCQPKSGPANPKSAKIGLCPCWTCQSPNCDCAPCTCFSA